MKAARERRKQRNVRKSTTSTNSSCAQSPHKPHNDVVSARKEAEVTSSAPQTELQAPSKTINFNGKSITITSHDAQLLEVISFP